MRGGIITLMGSGELSRTMVEIHKELVQNCHRASDIVFLDTPAGFQLNVDEISNKATAYFLKNIQRPMVVASLKSADVDEKTRSETYELIDHAKYILMGPGSPTYALSQWKSTPIPELLYRFLIRGGTLVAASAAALTLGYATLPVYEIYKVGQPPHWVEGLRLLDRFGFKWAVVPHWNNREGGNHDTRFCFMGEQRKARLLEQLSETTGMLGLDEHTALQIDLEKQCACVKGLGRITVLNSFGESVFGKGDEIPIPVLRGKKKGPFGSIRTAAPSSFIVDNDEAIENDRLWQKIKAIEHETMQLAEQNNFASATRLILDLDAYIWQSRQSLIDKEAIGAVRGVFRDLIASLGATIPDPRVDDRNLTPEKEVLATLVACILTLRDRCRNAKQWELADALRQCLIGAGIVVTDKPDGAQWQMNDDKTGG